MFNELNAGQPEAKKVNCCLEAFSFLHATVIYHFEYVPITVLLHVLGQLLVSLSDLAVLLF